MNCLNSHRFEGEEEEEEEEEKEEEEEEKEEEEEEKEEEKEEEEEEQQQQQQQQDEEEEQEDHLDDDESDGRSPPNSCHWIQEMINVKGFCFLCRPTEKSQCSVQTTIFAFFHRKSEITTQLSLEIL